MEPYCDAYVQAAREAVADETSMRYRFVQQSDPLRWLATLDALQSRLAAAEAAVAVRDALLARCRHYVCIIPAGRVDPESAHDGDQIAHAIDTLRGNASAKEAPYA